jgi:RNA-directed DNA polymerase
LEHSAAADACENCLSCATLTNCVRLGPETQNRNGHAQFRSHLEGRVGFVEAINPARGKRLRAIFNRIEW